MINLNYLKYFVDAAEVGSIAQAAKLNYVSSSAISQAIKWLEGWYQIDLIQHGKNRFLLTDKGREVVVLSQTLFLEANTFSEKIGELAKPGSGVLKFSVPQSLANSVVSKVIKEFKDQYPMFDLKVRIGTTHLCQELMNKGLINYSISMDNVKFKANAIPLYKGKFVFISAIDDKRKAEDAGFILTENTKEVIELKTEYLKKFKHEIPVNYSVSSWGVITNLALAGNGIAYIPDYYLHSLDKQSYRIRKVGVKQFEYNINFYSSIDSEVNQEHHDFIKLLKRQFRSSAR